MQEQKAQLETPEGESNLRKPPEGVDLTHIRSTLAATISDID